MSEESAKLAGWPTRITASAALITALVPIGTNAVGWLEYRDKASRPLMDWGMPDRIRLVQYQDGNETIIEAYVQPTFVNRGLNTRVKVICGIALSMEPVEGGSALDFRRRNHRKLSATTTGRSSAKRVAEEYTGDTASLLATPNQALASVVLFGPKVEKTDPYFEPGNYPVTLAVERTTK